MKRFIFGIFEHIEKGREGMQFSANYRTRLFNRSFLRSLSRLSSPGKQPREMNFTARLKDAERCHVNCSRASDSSFFSPGNFIYTFYFVPETPPRQSQTHISPTYVAYQLTSCKSLKRKHE